MIQIRELTEQEKKEAVGFMEWVSKMTYEEFEKWKKQHSWWMQTLLNWCRIRKDYPELNTIRETKFVLPDKQKKRDKNDYEIRAKMSKNKAILAKDHLLDEFQAKEMTYKIIHYTKMWDDECITIAIPYTFGERLYNKFWWWIDVYKSQCPRMFEEIMKNYQKYDWTAEFISNAERLNRKY